MLFIFITHPDAREKKEKNDPFFRGLTDKGCKQAISAAQRIRTLLAAENVKYVDTLLSSPKSRCIQALTEVCSPLHDMVKTDMPIVNENLQDGQLTEDSFREVLENLRDAKVILAFVHADLAGLFKDDIQESALDGIWFRKIRPVIALAKYDHSVMKLLVCEKLEASSWVSIRKET